MSVCCAHIWHFASYVISDPIWSQLTEKYAAESHGSNWPITTVAAVAEKSGDGRLIYITNGFQVYSYDFESESFSLLLATTSFDIHDMELVITTGGTARLALSDGANCIHSMNIATNTISYYIGRCINNGPSFHLSSFSTAAFRQPTGLTYSMVTQTLYVTVYSNKWRLLACNVISEQVTEITSSSSPSIPPAGLMYISTRPGGGLLIYLQSEAQLYRRFDNGTGLLMQTPNTVSKAVATAGGVDVHLTQSGTLMIGTSNLCLAEPGQPCFDFSAETIHLLSNVGTNSILAASNGNNNIQLWIMSLPDTTTTTITPTTTTLPTTTTTTTPPTTTTTTTKPTSTTTTTSTTTPTTTTTPSTTTIQADIQHNHIRGRFSYTRHSEECVEGYQILTQTVGRVELCIYICVKTQNCNIVNYTRLRECVLFSLCTLYENVSHTSSSYNLV